MVGWQLFKIGDRLPPVTFRLPFGALQLGSAILSLELRMAAKPIESVGGRVAASGHHRISMRL